MFYTQQWKIYMGAMQNTDLVNPLTANVSHHIETSQLIWIANQLSCFYMMENIGR